MERDQLDRMHWERAENEVADYRDVLVGCCEAGHSEEGIVTGEICSHWPSLAVTPPTCSRAGL